MMSRTPQTRDDESGAGHAKDDGVWIYGLALQMRRSRRKAAAAQGGADGDAGSPRAAFSGGEARMGDVKRLTNVWTACRDWSSDVEGL